MDAAEFAARLKEMTMDLDEDEEAAEIGLETDAKGLETDAKGVDTDKADDGEAALAVATALASVVRELFQLLDIPSVKN